MVRIIPNHELDDLEDAYERYMAAPLGSLNITADALRTAAIAAGYVPLRGDGAPFVGVLPWVRRRLSGVAD